MNRQQPGSLGTGHGPLNEASGAGHLVLAA